MKIRASGNCFFNLAAVFTDKGSFPKRKQDSEGICLAQKASSTRHISRKDGVEINTVPFEAAKVCRSSRGLSISVSDIHQSVPWRKRQV